MKKTINEIWKMTRLAAALVIAFVCIVIGIPGRLLCAVANWLMQYADRIGDFSKTSSIIGKFEKT